jgi:tRNA (Thr-GGU) A37 N-methylase
VSIPAARLRVRGVDMLDGTPVLDIKPYLSSIPAADLRRGWLDEAEARRGRAEPSSWQKIGRARTVSISRLLLRHTDRVKDV